MLDGAGSAMALLAVGLNMESDDENESHRAALVPALAPSVSASPTPAMRAFRSTRVSPQAESSVRRVRSAGVRDAETSLGAKEEATQKRRRCMDSSRQPVDLHMALSATPSSSSSASPRAEEEPGALARLGLVQSIERALAPTRGRASQGFAGGSGYSATSHQAGSHGSLAGPRYTSKYFNTMASVPAPGSLSSGCRPEGEKKQPQKGKEHQAFLDFSKLPAERRLREFWSFMVEAVKGVTSDEPFCREYEFGGILPFIADVRTVIEKVLIPFHDDVGEQLWRVMVVVWLGGGGPGFCTYRHVVDGVPMLGASCEQRARLPPLRADVDVTDMFEHLKALAEKHGRHQVLSGDGQHVQFRFGRQQGVEMLRRWRRCALELAQSAKNTREGFDALGPRAIFEHLTACPGIGNLAAKEVFCYLYAAYPRSFDVNSFVPVGAGAERGGRLVLGLSAEDKGVVWHDEFRQMCRDIPQDLSVSLATAIRTRARTCSYGDDPRVPGVRQQLELCTATAADVEVCMCFFMNFLKAKMRGTAPRGWRMLARSLWE